MITSARPIVEKSFCKIAQRQGNQQGTSRSKTSSQRLEIELHLR